MDLQRSRNLNKDLTPLVLCLLTSLHGRLLAVLVETNCGQIDESISATIRVHFHGGICFEGLFACFALLFYP